MSVSKNKFNSAQFLPPKMTKQSTAPPLPPRMTKEPTPPPRPPCYKSKQQLDSTNIYQSTSTYTPSGWKTTSKKNHSLTDSTSSFLQGARKLFKSTSYQPNKYKRFE